MPTQPDQFIIAIFLILWAAACGGGLLIYALRKLRSEPTVYRKRPPLDLSS